MYYVYILKNPLNSLPFYIGVGKENRRSNSTREQQHINDAIKLREGKKLYRPNRHKLHTILQILDAGMAVTIDIVARYDDEKLAFAEETRLIVMYGRSDLGLGPLTNLTDGGEGGINPSPETIAKISAALKGRESHLKGKIVGPYSDKHRTNISESMIGKVPWNKGKTGLQEAWNKGKTMTEDQRKNMGPPKGRVPWNKGKKGLVESSRKGKKGNPSPFKGIPSGKKGLTYEEIYGPEKAAELKEKRRLKKMEYWNNKNKD